MFFKETWSIIEKFFLECFNCTIAPWGCKVLNGDDPIIWNSICHWCCFFALLVIIFAILFSKTKVIERLSRHILVLSVMVWLFGVIVYIVGFYNNGVNGLSVVLRSILASFKMFAASNELASVSITLQHDPSYMAAFALLHFSAAFITVLFIFKMLGYKIRSSMRLIWHRYFASKNRVVHLFWGVNEASCLLAEDINRNHPADTIIFVDIDHDSDDNSQRKVTLGSITNSITIRNSEIELFDRIHAYVDHCYNGPAVLRGNGNVDIFQSLNLRHIRAIVRKSCQSNFYLLSNDEAQNIAAALNLQRDKRLITMGANRPTIYLHARRDSNNEVFDHYSQYDSGAPRMKIKVVDSAYLSVVTLKQQYEYLPVNCVNVNRSIGTVDSPFSSLIVGFGSTGQEVFKFLYEFATFIKPDLTKTPFKCIAIDKRMNEIAGVIREKMPNIGEDELVLRQETVDTKEFWTMVRNIINDLNYVVINLNNDIVGLSLAVNMFKAALQHRSANNPMLKIMIRCYDINHEVRMTEVVDNLNGSVVGRNVEICIFGKERDLYCCKTIIADEIMVDAMEFNWVYQGCDPKLSPKEQWERDFGNDKIAAVKIDKSLSTYHAIHDINRRISQNVLNAQHCTTKMALMGFAEYDTSDRLQLYNGYVGTRQKESTKYECSEQDAVLLRNMAVLEHERWMSSHKLMGFRYAPETDYVRKLNKNMCNWNLLEEHIKAHDCKVVDTTIQLHYRKNAKK